MFQMLINFCFLPENNFLFVFSSNMINNHKLQTTAAKKVHIVHSSLEKYFKKRRKHNNYTSENSKFSSFFTLSLS